MLLHKVVIKAAIFLTIFALLENTFLATPLATAYVKPLDPMRPDAVGVASFYSYECAKLPMANGKPFDPEKRTCASWFYKFGTVLIVRSLDTGRSTEVVVTDRGPNKRLVRQGRIIDLSRRAFEDIRSPRYGLTRVAVIVKSRK